MESRSGSTWVTSCLLAPVTMADKGSPCASTSRWRLLPFFPPIRRIGSDGLLGQRGFDLAPVDTLPAPGDPFHLVVFRQTRAPEGQKESCLQPSPEIGMHRTRASESFFGQSLPLAPRPQHKDDAFEDLPRVHGLAAPARLSPEHHPRRSSPCGNQRLHPLPEPIGNLPGSHSHHLHTSPRNMGRIHQGSKLFADMLSLRGALPWCVTER